MSSDRMLKILLLVSSALLAGSADPPVPPVPLDANECSMSCMDCRYACPEGDGSGRHGCLIACYEAASGCCSRNGREPPVYGGCSCR